MSEKHTDQDVVAALARLTQVVSGMDTRLQDLTSSNAEVVQRLTSVETRLEVNSTELRHMRARVADMESANRSAMLASKFTVSPFVNDLAPRGSAFRERVSDYKPLSPLAQ
jgi:hypothetical protein